MNERRIQFSFLQVPRFQNRTANAVNDDAILSGFLRVNCLAKHVSVRPLIRSSKHVLSCPILKCFLLKFHVFLGLSWSLSIFLVVLQSMIFACGDNLKVVEGFFRCWLSIKKFTMSLTWLEAGPCLHASWTVCYQELCLGCLESVFQKTELLGLICLPKGLQSWASHL